MQQQQSITATLKPATKSTPMKSEERNASQLLQGMI